MSICTAELALLRRFDLRPFRVSGPTSISFSGGRTSGLMLYLTLLANDGVLPDDCVVTFANTGREHSRTLDFVARCASEWGVPIVWLEWSPDAPGYRVVSHNSASRKGEPYAGLVARRQYTPNPLTRFCTQELKIRTMERYLKAEHGWSSWAAFVGLRADEPSRVAKLRARCGAKKEASRGRAPLADVGITEADVLAFWAEQGFDLGIDRHWGNCDLCFLKGKAKLLQVIREDPGAVDWWLTQERVGKGTFHGPHRFRGLGYGGFRDAVAAEARGEGPAEEWHRKQPWAHQAAEAFDELGELECACTD